jgi:predicted GH43/DUF377 family glycosyl hydrolase
LLRRCASGVPHQHSTEAGILQPSPSHEANGARNTVKLPPALDRVLRDYEQHWRSGSAEALVALFTADLDGSIRS